ncbi:Lachrymatory-factor synthase [Rhynchospora pubera]|uniref:Lachrymatory-factor synthase n=1 Tax=Rhynchospora pubera TaxID=906938 RepID=A0AAV8DN33_9POAL|nr:Lachrymatory-factor synthase [Rhynchospora pubera]
MDDQLQIEKWEGKVALDISTNEIQAWSLLSEFFNLHLWLPGIATCEKVTGSEALPGSVRYVASPANESGKVSWAKEELIGFDPVEKSFSYRVVESSMGFGEYVAHFRVLPGTGVGCRLEWSFECEPVIGWSREGLIGYLDSSLKGMAERLEKATNPDAKTTDDKVSYETNGKLDGKANGDKNSKANDVVNCETNCEVNVA